MHAQPYAGARCVHFGLSLHSISYVCVSKNGSEAKKKMVQTIACCQCIIVHRICVKPLKNHPDISSKARGLNFGKGLHLHSYLAYVSRKGSGPLLMRSVSKISCTDLYIVSWNISILNRGSYRSAHVLLNLLNELGKRDKMRGLPSILSLFRNKFIKFNNTRA